MPRASKLLLPIIYLGFISLGLPDGVLSVAWPSMRQSLGLPLGLAGTLLLVVTLLSGVSSFFSGRILARFQTGPVVMVSWALTGSALLLISPARAAAWLTEVGALLFTRTSDALAAGIALALIGVGIALLITTALRLDQIT